MFWHIEKQERQKIWLASPDFRAIEAAEKALKLLGEKTPALAENIRKRLGLYKAGKPPACCDCAAWAEKVRFSHEGKSSGENRAAR